VYQEECLRRHFNMPERTKKPGNKTALKRLIEEGVV